MTFKEKLQMEHPWMNETITDVVIKELCPCDLGYEKRNEACHHYRSDEECIRCWNREMPNTELVKTVTLPMPPNTDKPFTEKEVYEEAGYNKGLNDAWEFIKNLWSIVSDSVKMELFGTIFVTDILKNYTPQEAIAKMKAYEEAQIEVGDVVWVINEVQIVVTSISNNKIYGFDALGRISSGLLFSECKKTGKHIDIKSILESIGE